MTRNQMGALYLLGLGIYARVSDFPQWAGTAALILATVCFLLATYPETRS